MRAGLHAAAPFPPAPLRPHCCSRLNAPSLRHYAAAAAPFLTLRILHPPPPPQVPLPEKMNSLWSFIKTHLTAKTIVFLSSCRQVQFVHEAMCQLRPGIPLRCLHGKMKQIKRMATFYDFAKAESMVLFATDVAARGLDFPTVDWVVQADCPEDVQAYIHRVGRTARYTAAGRGLLFLAPSEKAFAPLLLGAKIPIKEIHVNPTKQLPVTPALEGLLSKDSDLRVLAQKAMATYLKSVHMNANKAVFDVSALPLGEYANSLGLAAPPRRVCAFLSVSLPHSACNACGRCGV